jgi:hypothetical protein
VQSFQNEKTLLEKARELKQELQKHEHRFENVSKRQAETSQALERLNKNLEEVTVI